MRQGLALFCLVVVIVKGQGQGQGKGQRHGQGQGQGRIIGGEEAGAKEVPWQVKKIFVFTWALHSVFNRSGVARAVLLTPSYLIH